MIDDELDLVGHHVAGDAAFDAHRLQGLAVLAAVEHRPALVVQLERRKHARARRWIALRPIHGLAVWARSPRSTMRRRMLPWHPASMPAAVGSPKSATSPSSRSGRAASISRNPLCSDATSSRA